MDFKPILPEDQNALFERYKSAMITVVEDSLGLHH